MPLAVHLLSRNPGLLAGRNSANALIVGRPAVRTASNAGSRRPATEPIILVPSTSRVSKPGVKPTRATGENRMRHLAPLLHPRSRQKAFGKCSETLRYKIPAVRYKIPGARNSLRCLVFWRGSVALRYKRPSRRTCAKSCSQDMPSSKSFTLPPPLTRRCGPQNPTKSDPIQ